MAHGSEVEVLRMGNLHESYIRINFIILGLLMPHFRLLMGANPSTLTILDQAVVSLVEMYILGFKVEVDIIGQTYLLGIV